MKNLIIYAAAILGLLTFSGCNEFLDKIPDNRTELDDKGKISELLVNAYPKANYISFCEVMSDNAGDKGPSVSPWTLNTEPFFWKDSSGDNIDTPSNYWDACYNAIAHANMALEAIDASDNKVNLSAQRGEALVCRAYAHFMLVALFGKTYDVSTADSDLGIPYITEVEKQVKKAYKRETVAKVYELVERDLTEGMLLLSDDSYRIPKYHFTKAAAYAFASRFFLFKKNYAQVVKYADLVLGANVTDKLRNWNAYAKLSFYEFRQTYTLSSERSILLLQESLTIWGRQLQNYRYSLSSDKMAELFNAKNVTDGSWLYAVSGRENTYGVAKFEEYFKKVSVDATTGWPFNMVPLFTCEEVLFNRLEAQIMLNTPAVELIPVLNDYLALRIAGFNVVTNGLTVSKITDFYKKGTEKENMLTCLLSFKRVDFIHEGLRWFDILRNNLEVVHTTKDGQVLTLKPTDLRRVIQIPLRAINSGIPANPR